MSSSTIFVDGASGFNATWEIQTLLQKGHNVVVSVRSPSKRDFLQSLFGPAHGARLSVIVMPRGSRASRRTSSSESISSTEGDQIASDLAMDTSSPMIPTPTALPDKQRVKSQVPSGLRTGSLRSGRDSWIRPSLRMTPMAVA